MFNLFGTRVLWLKEKYARKSSVYITNWGDEANTTRTGSFRLTPERATFICVSCKIRLEISSFGFFYKLADLFITL